MKKSWTLLLILIVNFLSSLSFFVSSAHSDITYKNGDRITSNTTWSGYIYIFGTLYIDKGVNLLIKPGTKVFFKKVDEDNDGISESLIISSGANIKAVGTKDNPIVFTSLEKEKHWGDWKEIQLNYSKEIIFDSCIFEFGEYALHIHFSEGIIKNCIFRNNADGTRIGNSKLIFQKNLFEKNVGKALNFTSSDLIVENNTIRQNRDGLFVFEKSGKCLINRNNIYDNHSNIKVGDFFSGRLVVGETFSKDTIKEDKKIEVNFVKKPFLNALPELKDAYTIFEIDTEGFVDGEGTIYNNYAYFPSFDGHIYEVNLNSLEYTRYFIGDFTDAKPVVDNSRVYAISWDGKIIAFEKGKKKKLWEQNFMKSLKDDHRIASPILYKNYIVAISPGGNLKVINKDTGNLVFDRLIEGEFRTTPFLFNDFIVMPSLSNGVYILDMKKLMLTNIIVDGKFYSSPVLFNGFLYLLDSSGKLYIFDKNFKLSKSVKLKGNYRFQSPIIFKGKLFVFSLDGYIVEIKSLNEISYKKTEYIFSSTPAVLDSVIIVPTFQGEIFIYDSQNYFTVGNFGEIQFSPIIYKDNILFGTRQNKIYGIKLW